MSETLAERARRYAQKAVDATNRAIEAPGKAIKPMSQEDQSALAARIMRAKIEAQMYSAPKAMWVEQNVPGMHAAGEAFRKVSVLPKDAPVDGGELDEPADRQPVSMSREFPSTAQGKADQEEYIRNARETARKALNK